jgi:pimeloyl-ACP methyl ester carboxylesterase
MIKECPETKFALSGYSQGGIVVTSAAAKLPANLTEKVLAMVIYGAGEASNVKGPLKARTLANCAPGDFVSFQSGDRDQLLTTLKSRLARRVDQDLDMYRTIIKVPYGTIDLPNTLYRLFLAKG